jgi:hypothetical protein
MWYSGAVAMDTSGDQPHAHADIGAATWEDERLLAPVPAVAVASSMSSSAVAVATLYAVFLTGLMVHVLPNWRMFTRRSARRHRLAGLAMLVWLLLGLVNALRVSGHRVLGLDALMPQGESKMMVSHT